jgi:predicted dehydrogenase
MAYHALYVSEREQRAPIVRVAAALGSFGNDSGVDDTGAVVLVHANGGISVVQRCWLAQGGGAGAHEIHGTRGSIRFAQLDTRVMSHIFQGDYGAAAAASRDVDAGPPVEIFENEVGEWAPLELSPGPLNWWDGIREVFRQTLARWSIGESAPVGIASARHTLAAVEACYLSAERGTSVELAELERDAHNHRSPR